MQAGGAHPGEVGCVQNLGPRLVQYTAQRRCQEYSGIMHVAHGAIQGLHKV